MNEFLEQFLIEARELVEQGTADLLALEAAPADRANLDGAFRAFHTLKGGAGIVDFEAMSRAMHAAEDGLAKARAGEQEITASLVGACLGCLDQVVLWLDVIQESGALPTQADAAADDVVALFQPAGDAAGPSARLPDDASWTPAAPPAGGTALAVLREQLELIAVPGEDGMDGRRSSAARVAGNLLRYLGRPGDAVEIERGLAQAKDGGASAVLTRAIQQIAGQTAVVPAVEASPAGPREPLSRTLRVDAARVNQLLNLTIEMTVAKNSVGHIAKLAADSGSALTPALQDEHARLARLVGALQHTVLSLRVLPLRSVFQRFSRPVREMSASVGKPTQLLMEGEDTEADKAIGELLFEPLLHVVRNAIDHGIEPAAGRAAAGKPPVGTISLRARRQDEFVVIDVADDGGGIDVARVRQTAIARGVATTEGIAALADSAVVELIFAPGFSTAPNITGLSGRGVGMDAVRTTIERLGGRVEVDNRPGVGCTVRFVLPFSTMLVRVITVEAGGQTFGIPVEMVVETVRLDRAQIHPVGNASAFVYRKRTVPLTSALPARWGMPIPRRGKATLPWSSPMAAAILAGWKSIDWGNGWT